MSKLSAVQPESPAWTLFIELVQVSSGGRTALSRTPSSGEWATLHAMARGQAMAGTLFGGVQRLPREQLPPRDLLLSWYATAERICALNRRLNEECVRVGRHLRAQGFEHTILKGQPVAALYDDPFLRTPGDIDVWVRPVGERRTLSEVREAVLGLARRLGPLEGVTYCHVHYPLLGQTEVELHFTPSWMSGWRANRRLQWFFADEADAQFAHAVTLPGTDGSVNAPTDGFNRLYILLHIYRHLLGEGVGLRQLADYSYVLRRPCTAQERAHTLVLLKRMGLTRFARAVMYVMREVFALPDSHLLLPPDEREGRFLLAEVMRSGNFGKQDPRVRPTPLRRHASVRFVSSLVRNAAFLRHYPGEVVRDPFFRLWLYFWRKGHGWI